METDNKPKIPPIQMMFYWICMITGLLIVFLKEYLVDVIQLDKSSLNNLFRIMMAICALYCLYISVKIYKLREAEEETNSL